MPEEFTPLIYLACPYAHCDPIVMKKRHFIANKVASELIAKGVCVYSPLTHDIPLNELGIGGNFEFWEKHNHAMVSRCDKLMLIKIPGWEQSKGVAGELECARKHKIPIEEMEGPDEKAIEQWMITDGMKALLNKMNQMWQERDWEKFHSPKNLAMNLAVEVGELLEHFRWLTESQSFEIKGEARHQVEDEIGDVFIQLLHLCDKLSIDPLRAASQKLGKVAEKYPVSLCKGKCLKYTEYPSVYTGNT